MKTNIDKNEWIKSTYGKQYDVDGAYGNQCWDYWAFFNQDMQTGLNMHCSQTGYVCDLWRLKDTYGYSECYEYIKPSDIRRGDWLIWDKGSSCALSHVALMISDRPDKSGYGMVQGQNQGGVNGAVNAIYQKLDVLGGFRYKGWQGANPSTGWKLDGGTWYYYENGQIKTGWLFYNKKWYYLKSNGAMASKEWILDKGKWYYLKENGDMAVGWLSLNKVWYYLNADGSMKTNGWILHREHWYYVGADGKMMTEWIHDGNSWYYMNASGVMLTNTTVGGYRLGEDGKLVQ